MTFIFVFFFWEFYDSNVGAFNIVPEVSEVALISFNSPFFPLCLSNANQTQRANIKSSKRKQQITHKGIPIRITADLSIEILQARRKWHDILKVMKEKSLQPRLLYPARISFKYEGEIKSFTDKQELREFSTTKPAHQQMVKDLL